MLFDERAFIYQWYRINIDVDNKCKAWKNANLVTNSKKMMLFSSLVEMSPHFARVLAKNGRRFDFGLINSK